MSNGYAMDFVLHILHKGFKLKKEKKRLMVRICIFFFTLQTCKVRYPECDTIWIEVHLGQKCLPRVACLWSKMPMFQRAGMREGGEPLPLAFQYLILMV